MDQDTGRGMSTGGVSTGGVSNSGSYDSSKNAFLSNLSFLRGFGTQKKSAATGQAPKRRGPKPDSKPAQTRRQELNRQAQRTHRERKEQYLRALENEVARLREGYSELAKTSSATNDQLKNALQAVMDENRILQQILTAHGISYEHETKGGSSRFGGGGPGGGFGGAANGMGPGGEGNSFMGGGPSGMANGGMSGGMNGSNNMAWSGASSGNKQMVNGANLQTAMSMSSSPSTDGGPSAAGASAGTAFTSPPTLAHETSSPQSPGFADRQMEPLPHDQKNQLEAPGRTSMFSNRSANSHTPMLGAMEEGKTSLSIKDSRPSGAREAENADTSVLKVEQPIVPMTELAPPPYNTTLPLPLETSDGTYPSAKSGIGAISDVQWTGLGDNWDMIEKPDGVGAVPGVFEKDPQLEVDFVLNLESPCRNHMEYLNRRAMEDPEQEIFCGHTLMATCPPPTYCENHPPGQLYPLQTYDVPRSSLNRLLNLSRQLVTEGQITPIMAVQSIKSHTSYTALTANDIRHIMDELINKIRCYGFGAVVEDFEFMDAMTSVLSNKHEGAGVLSGLRSTDPSVGERAADRYKRMFGYKLASMQADGKYIGGGGVAGPGMPQVDEFLYA